MADLGGDPEQINPLIPVELVIDHSVQVDVFGTSGAFARNVELEFERNRERYAFLRWGQKGFRDFKVVPPGTGHRPPGEPRVPRARRRGARRSGVPRHARRHRLAHDDGERPRRARLGRRRDRGGGGDARRAALDARAAGRRLQADRCAARGRDRDRPRADRDRAAPPGGRGREVRRVLRPRPRLAAARRPRDDREHVPGVRRDVRLLPGRRADARVPAPDRPQRRADRPRRGLLQGEHALARPERGADVLAGARARPLDGRAVARRPAPAAGPRAALAREDGVPRLARHVRRRERRSRTAAPTRRSPTRSPPATRPREQAPGGSPEPEPDSTPVAVAGPGRTSVQRRRHRLRARARQRRDRRDHLLHEHVEPAGDGRRRPAGEEGGRARPDAASPG